MDEIVSIFPKSSSISLWDQDGPTDFIDAADMLGNFYVLATGENFTSKDFYIIGDDSASYSVNVTMTTITTTDDDDDTLYRSMIWNEFQIDTSQTTSNLPNDLFTSDNAKYQRTYRPVGSIIQFNDHFNLYFMVNNAIVMDDGDDD